MIPKQWLTANVNPRARISGMDAGVHAWRLHAVEALKSESFNAVRDRKALCGLVPRYGWGLDMFIERKCAVCLAKCNGEVRDSCI